MHSPGGRFRLRSRCSPRFGRALLNRTTMRWRQGVARRSGGQPCHKRPDRIGRAVPISLVRLPSVAVLSVSRAIRTEVAGHTYRDKLRTCRRRYARRAVGSSQNAFPNGFVRSGRDIEMKERNSVGQRTDLGFDPTGDASVEHIQREGATGENLVMEGFEVELGPKLLFGAFAQLADLELAELIAAGLTRSGNVAVCLSLDRRFINRVGVAHIFDDPIAAPVHVVNTGVYNKAHGPEQFRADASVVGAGVLVEADLLAELLGVETPALSVGGVLRVPAELRQSG